MLATIAGVCHILGGCLLVVVGWCDLGLVVVREPLTDTPADELFSCSISGLEEAPYLQSTAVGCIYANTTRRLFLRIP